MPRFYFHIRDHAHVIPDVEGIDMPGVGAAFQEAEEAAREILAGKVRRGEVIDGQQFEVYDDRETKLFTVPFKSVLKFE